MRSIDLKFIEPGSLEDDVARDRVEDGLLLGGDGVLVALFHVVEVVLAQEGLFAGGLQAFEDSLEDVTEDLHRRRHDEVDEACKERESLISCLV